jgi:flagellar hook-basal body complex protein FliE
MSIEPIGAVGMVTTDLASMATRQVSSSSSSFMDAVSQGMATVNADLQRADQMLKSAAAGAEIAPHQLMIAMEEAQMSLMLAVELRNRLTESYQELMRMQL